MEYSCFIAYFIYSLNATTHIPLDHLSGIKLKFSPRDTAEMIDTQRPAVNS